MRVWSIKISLHELHVHEDSKVCPLLGECRFIDNLVPTYTPTSITPSARGDRLVSREYNLTRSVG
jgi:hypothetical protein